MKRNYFNKRRNNVTSEENNFNIEKQFNKLAVNFSRKHRFPSVTKRHLYKNEVWNPGVILPAITSKQLTYLSQVVIPT